MHTYNYYKKFFTFYKKIYNYIKKILHHTIIKKKISCICKNGKPRAKIIIKWIEINSRT